MQVASELKLGGLLVNVLWQCLYVTNADCIRLDTCRIDCESAVAVLNQGSYCIVAVCIEVVAEPLQLCTQLLIPVAPRPFPQGAKSTS